MYRARRRGGGRLPALLLLLLLGGAAGLGRLSGPVSGNSPAGRRLRGLRGPLRGTPGPGEWVLEGDGDSRFSLRRRRLLLLRTAEGPDREARPEYGRRRRAGRHPREALLRVRVLSRSAHRPRLAPGVAEPGTEVARLRALDGVGEASGAPRRVPPSRLLVVVPGSGRGLTAGSLPGLPRCRRHAAAGAGGRRRARSLLPPGTGSRRYTARLPHGARVGDTVFTVPRSRDRAAGGWFELASPGAVPVGVDRASGRLYLRRELRAGGRAEVLVKVHRGGGRGRGRAGPGRAAGMGRIPPPVLPPVGVEGRPAGGGTREGGRWAGTAVPGACHSRRGGGADAALRGAWGAAGGWELPPGPGLEAWGCADSSLVPPAPLSPVSIFEGIG
ncbi:uncharacterized protein LOC142053744 [Phalacrocorax aristotelis]|uniref:uncharacterized protein LOC142053744 n=1 Tax=Phalacrocorax aristotelis TaxID=126867 RepID=UPI003F4C4C31